MELKVGDKVNFVIEIGYDLVSMKTGRIEIGILNGTDIINRNKSTFLIKKSKGKIVYKAVVTIADTNTIQVDVPLYAGNSTDTNSYVTRYYTVIK